MFSSKPWGVESPEHWGTLTIDEGGEPVSTRVPTEPGDYRGYYINLRDAIHGNAALEVTPLQALENYTDAGNGRWRAAAPAAPSPATGAMSRNGIIKNALPLVRARRTGDPTSRSVFREMWGYHRCFPPSSCDSSDTL